MTILHSTDFFKAGISTVAIEPRLPQSAFPEHHHDFHEIVIVEQDRVFTSSMASLHHWRRFGLFYPRSRPPSLRAHG